MAIERRGLRLARVRLSREDFARVYRAGRRAQGGLFAVVVLENGLGRTRLGLSVSKRRLRRAVRRNRVRRVFREAFRLALPELPSGLDVVLIATGTEFDPRLEETRAELLELVQRALRRRPRTAPEARPRRGERAR